MLILNLHTWLHSVAISGFYVKSILEHVEVLKLPFFAILGALNVDNLVNLRL